MAKLETVTLKKDGGVAVLTLNRPQRLNAFNEVLGREMLACIQECNSDGVSRVLVLTGAGRAFCAGGDFRGDPNALLLVSEKRPSVFVQGYRGLIPQIITGLQSSFIPTIAMVNGLAHGVGFCLSLACDIRFGSENSRFCVAWLKRGLVPAGGTSWLLPRIVGMGRAAEIMFSRREVQADEAEKIGILNRLVPSAKLEEQTMEYARELAKGPGMAINLTKMNMYRGTELDLAAALELAGITQGIAVTTEDFAEASKAFREKREPVYKGR
ncbi:MAG: enoyl-CoA hydratase/isomerase family protein [Chloroflexi bacterium]|nr:enoyl-CoA hydratase/isomerase family protein [Chloroflexota bacterium]